MVVLLEGSPISTEELWSSVRVTIGFLVTSLTKVLLLRLLNLAWWPALGRVLVVPNFFHLRMMEAIVFLVPFPQICASTQFCLEDVGAISSTSWRGFLL